MTDHVSLFALLDRSDISYDKLIELERRMIAATDAGKVDWERQGEDYTWASPKGVLDVTPAGVSIYDDSGVRLRRFRYATDALYDSVARRHEAMACDLIDRLIADLDALDAA